MGASAQIDIHGEKGGSGKPKSPTEASDSLRSTNLTKLLIAVGEGEFDSVPTDYDIYPDNTPIRDASGNYNFPNVKSECRPGSIDQTYIPVIPSVENETSLNIDSRSDSPWVRSITNTQLSAVRMRLAWPALQRRHGDRPTELSAIGCTLASEAQRRGKWAILSNNQDRTVSFKTGMEGVIPLPGHIIPVADSLLAGREVGGRISAVARRMITLDRDTQAKAGDRLIINLPGGRAEGWTVQSVNGRAETVTVAYSEQPVPQLQWPLDADDLAIPLYRVLRTRRTTEGEYEISALQFEPSKFAFIDTGARLPDPTGGATHYYATSIKAPAWAPKAKQTLKLGGHVFFKDVP